MSAAANENSIRNFLAHSVHQRGDKADQFGSRGLNEIILLGALPNQKKRRHLIVRNYANKSSPKFCFIPSDLAVNDKRAQEELPKQGSCNKRNRLIHFNNFHAKLF